MSTAGAERLGFQAEVKQLLGLIIHSVYSEREIFLRELVSNASDALDRLRFSALTNPALPGDDTELQVHIALDAAAKTITITDNGIGMNRDEVVRSLGTIAHSGTREFLHELNPEQLRDSNLIGKFGIGFYSAFLVAARVVVLTRRASAAQHEGVRWESMGDGEYSVASSEKLTRGTEITLHLREDAYEFLNALRIRRAVRNYSDHIAYKVHLSDRANGINEEQLNQAVALWRQPKSTITDKACADFYRHVSHDHREPLAWTHAHIEGKLACSLLLYVPSRAPLNMWSQDAQHGVRLYVRRVFVAEGARNLLPPYLRFIRGVIESDDLPLNVSRELLQNNRIINEIRSIAIARVVGCLEELGTKDPTKFAQFWQEFGEAIKEGVGDDALNRDKLASLLRFASTQSAAADENVGLHDYVLRMRPGQKSIYYLTSDSVAAGRSSPLLEIFRKKGIEVLLLAGRNDPWMMSHLTEFDGHKFESAASSSLDLSAIEDVTPTPAATATERDAKPDTADLRSIVARIAEVLGDRVQDVVLSSRLDTSPACLVARGGGELKTLLQRNSSAYRRGDIVLEINPQHSLVRRLQREGDARFGQWAELLYQESVLGACGELEDPADFVHKMNGLLTTLVEALERDPNSGAMAQQ